MKVDAEELVAACPRTEKRTFPCQKSDVWLATGTVGVCSTADG
jgi:hypothetical protein